MVYLNPLTNVHEILTFNPLTGAAAGKAVAMSEKFVQAVLLHHTTEEHFRQERTKL